MKTLRHLTAPLLLIAALPCGLLAGNQYVLQGSQPASQVLEDSPAPLVEKPAGSVSGRGFILQGTQTEAESVVASISQGIKEKAPELISSGPGYILRGGPLQYRVTAGEAIKVSQQVKKDEPGETDDQQNARLTREFCEGLQLQGVISGASGSKSIVIQDQLLKAGADAVLNLKGRQVRVHCMEIGEGKAWFEAEGIKGRCELSLKPERQ